MCPLVPIFRKSGLVPILVALISVVRVAAASDPAITTHPTNLTVKAGSNPSLSVAVTGTEPLSYQWYMNGQPMGTGAWSGQTTNVLRITNARELHEGEYYVVVTNGLGSATSSNATLTVDDPAILSQPVNVNLPMIGGATLSMAAVGTPPFSYQWRFEGSPIARATNNSVYIFGGPTNAGRYDALVSNAYGSATSATAVLTFNTSFIDNWLVDGNGAVQTIAIQPDGRTVVGGSFSTLESYTRNRIARSLADGSVDADFNPNANGDVFCIMALPDGKLLVGGAFTSLGGRPCAYLGRLHPNGTLDTNFTATATGTIYCLARQQDGLILAGGINRLMRFDENGTTDPTFTPSVIGTVYCIAPQDVTPVAETGIFVGGQFSSVAGSGRQNLARLRFNGQIDPFLNTPVTGTVYAMASTGGGVVLGGQFTKIGQTARTNLARLDLAGQLVTSFDPGANGIMYSLAFQADGKLLVGGSFSSLGGVQRANLGRLLPNGSIDPVFNPGASQTVYSLALQADGKLIGGGAFTTFGGAARQYLARLDATNDVAQSLTSAGGKITWLRGGALPFVKEVMFDRYVAGTGWVSIGAGQPIAGGWEVAGTVPPNTTLRAWGRAVGGRGGGSGSIIQYATGPVVILTQPQGRNITTPVTTVLSVEAAGAGPFTYQWFRNGVPLSGATSASYTFGSIGSYQVTVCNSFGCVQSEVATIWRLNTPETAARPDPDGGVYALAVQPDGKVLMGGAFSVASRGNVRPGLARLAADGSFDTNFNASISGGTVLCLAVQPDGQILLGGSFTNVGGVTRYGLARIHEDGTLDTGFTANAFGGVLGTAVYCLSLQSDGRILAGGSFSSIGGQPRNCLARLEASGTVDPGFVPAANLHPDREVNSILQVPGGLLMLGGRFGINPGTYQTHMWVQANGSYAGSGYPTILLNTAVYALLAQPDGRTVLGGYDVRVDSAAGRMIARLNANHSMDATFPATANGPVYCLAAQADGKILVGGAFTTLNGSTRNSLGRLNTDGSLDPDFNPSVTGTTTAVYALAPRWDGKVCVGGSFTNMGTVTRYNFARLPATAFVSEAWTYAGAALTWTRAGQAAEFASVTLETSPDGITWQPLAEAARVGDAWQFAGVTFPMAQPARARGVVVASGVGTWQQVAPFEAPEIVTQPVSRTNALGSIAGFYVAAEGQGPLAYQWFRDGVALQDGGPVAGARSALLTFRVEETPGGNFYVVVSNLFGATNSSAATLTTYDLATPPLILADEPALGIYTNRFTFRYQGVPGQTCVVERADSMKSFWSSVSTNILNSFNPVVFTDPATPTTQRYYRIRLQK